MPAPWVNSDIPCIDGWVDRVFNYGVSVEVRAEELQKNWKNISVSIWIKFIVKVENRT